MNIFKPFKAVMPRQDLARFVCSQPYDVLSAQEAMQIVEQNPLSYLAIEKSEINYEHSDLQGKALHLLAKERLGRMLSEETLIQEDSEKFYIYRQEIGGHQQHGIVGTISVEEYLRGRIKKHENTRVDKEAERAEHIDAVNAQTGPVFIFYPKEMTIDTMVKQIVNTPPYIDFVADDGSRHSAWKIEDHITISKIQKKFSQIDTFYIADGHHRAAAAARVARERGNYQAQECGYFLCVAFPDDQVKIIDYNRVVKNLNGLSPQDFLHHLEQDFLIQKESKPLKPTKKGEFAMYLQGEWFLLKFKSEPKPRLTGMLDVSILQDFVLFPLLGIADPRSDKNIDFIGGTRGIAGVQKCVDSGDFSVGFLLYPTSLSELITIALGGEVMPPKSTWFEPKLMSGLFTHLL
ncbi:MAG: DUF1015 family protein [Deltaproteobacteria bacterium]|nr:DUF1015 family protein [Deltaproteobacteria bacterium]